MRIKSLAALFFLTACAPGQNAQVTMSDPAAPFVAGPALPAMQAFPGAPGQPVQRSNREIMQDFLDLEFTMESGRPLPRLTRFEGPIGVRLTGAVPVTAPADLTRVINRFRTEAGIDISPVTGPQAQITVEFVPRATLRRIVPSATCFVVPNVGSLAEYRAKRGTPAVDWANLTTRTRAAIFVPADTSPQEVRDCFHEELAQAMGPLNDLYRLADSVFNDDNFNTVLTGFDMLMLRLHYSPELASGMNEAQVAARLPALLARMNPQGEGMAGEVKYLSPRSWVEAVGAALGNQGNANSRRAAAERMLSIARAQGWTDNRLAFSHYAVGRTNVESNLPYAISHFSQAGEIYRRLPGAAMHSAHIDMQLGALALQAGEFGKAIAFADRALPAARQGENAALLATIQMIRSEALSAAGRPDEARQARLDSLGWARYGFGSDAQIRARMTEISALASRGQRG